VPEREAPSGRVLNLCFHGIGTPGRELEPDEDQFWVEPDVFAAMLDAVAGQPRVRISFDDGNESDVVHALPALRDRGLTASFFVLAGRIGQPGSLSAAGIATLAGQGMTVGSHGMGHRDWRTVDDAGLRLELTDAADQISAAAGRPVTRAACPFGSYDRRVLTALRRHGYERVYTVDGGGARAGAWQQARYTVRSDDTAAGIAALAARPDGPRLPAAVRAGKTVVKRWR
jgi:peptidoglycan/xylan/chitin deacetylase (PgdA/CDA1 family)